MEIVKKNLVSCICAAVALLAVILVFVAMGGLYGGLDKKLQESRKMHSELKRLTNEKFKMPLVDAEYTEALPLEQFPTKAITALGEKVVTAMHEQSLKMLEAAIKMNEKKPVAADALTKRGGAAMGIFKREYYKAMGQLKQKLNCTAPPSVGEFEKEKEREWKNNWEPRVLVVGGQRVNEQEIRAEFEKKLDDVWQTLLEKRAEGFTMYLRDEKVLDYHPGITPPADPRFPEVADVWAAQLSLWIQQDLVDAIAAVNGAGKPADGAGSVAHAVVKRLVKVEIPKEYVTATGRVAIGGGGGSSSDGMGGEAPAQVATEGAPAAEGAASPSLVRVFKQSPTGRVCNPLYDVMHFTVVVDADAKRFPEFLSRLMQGKFITILRADMVGIDREKARSAGYVYASPTVQLTLQCEAIFLREWTAGPRGKWMPPEVQKLLGIGVAAPASPVGAEGADQ